MVNRRLEKSSLICVMDWSLSLSLFLSLSLSLSVCVCFVVNECLCECVQLFSFITIRWRQYSLQLLFLDSKKLLNLLSNESQATALFTNQEQNIFYNK